MTMLVMRLRGRSPRNRRGLRHVRAIKLLRGGRQLHWMVYVACAAFVVYFCLSLIEGGK